VLSAFADFTDAFPVRWAQEARERGVPLLISWEPWDSDSGYADQPRYALDRIAAGDFDSYAHAFAAAAKVSGASVIIRFGAEMNGDWQVWNKNDAPTDYVAAFRHLHGLFTADNVRNVAWSFNPVNTWEGAPPYADYWPGAAYVDWLGLDGYTWQTVLPGREYTSPGEVFGESLAELRALAPALPVMIAECGSPPAGKRLWITQLADWVPKHGISMVAWFEHVKETDWRMSALNRNLLSLLRTAGWQVRPDQ
jgi:beta-mannanase